jgi:hypothetical protein
VGTLHYDGDSYDLDDRTLFHLQLAISTKLRRGENFFLTWPVPVEQGSGRHSIWIDNGVPIHIYYSGSRQIGVNREWVEALVSSAAHGGGMFVGSETEQTAQAGKDTRA